MHTHPLGLEPTPQPPFPSNEFLYTILSALYTQKYPNKSVCRYHTMTLRWFTVAQSPRAYTLSHPSTLSHSSVANTRLLVCSKE